jgi:hypothetical protein
MGWVDGHTVALQPGLIWKEVLDFTISRKLAPPVLPDTIFTTVGGTTSAGGIGETSYRLGALVDHIVELTAVLMNGDKVYCSPHNRKELFYAILSGMGQVGIIVEVKLKLMAAPDLVYSLSVTYDALDLTYLRDLKLISSQENFGAIGGHIVKSDDGKLKYVLDVTYWSELNPSWIKEIGGVHGEIKKWSFYEYSNRNTKGWYDAINIGALNFPRPYLSFFLPESSMVSVLDFILKDPDGMLGVSRVYVTPLVRTNFKSPLLSLPESKIVYHVRFYRIVRSTPGGQEHQRMLGLNKNKLLPWILNLGGTMYLPFSPLFSEQQVHQQFSPKIWKQFLEIKLDLDDHHVLNRGVGLFSN